jgi:cob(I)alamin adenosyltransferase
LNDRVKSVRTGTGDAGTSSPDGTQRLEKSAPVFEAFGTLDEAAALISVCIAELERSTTLANEMRDRMRATLSEIRPDLTDLAASIARPEKASRPIVASTERVRSRLSEWESVVPPRRGFRDPGRSLFSCRLDHARTVVRRAERAYVAYLRADRPGSSHEGIGYLNALSDLLYVVSRAADEYDAT